MKSWIILPATLSLALLGCDQYSGDKAPSDGPKESKQMQQDESSGLKIDVKKDSDDGGLKIDVDVKKPPADEAKEKPDKSAEPTSKKDQGPPETGTPPKEPAPGDTPKKD